MAHLPPLITDLALISGAAAISTLIFKRLKKPLVIANALVVGIERNNDRILNPESYTVLQPRDNLFIVGNPLK
jgi:hypothetical protein